MFCSKCGNRVPDIAAFCPKCGAQVRKPIQEDTKPQFQPARQVQPEPRLQAQRATTPAPKRSKAPLVIAIAAIIVVAAIGIGAYFALLAPYALDEKTVPDEALRSALAEKADADKDGNVSRDEAKALTSLDLSGSGVASLDGLELFPNLRSLDLSSTPALAKADFSKTKALEELDLTDSAIAAADVSPLTNLKSLRATGAGITSLDVSRNAALSALNIEDSVEVVGLDATNLREQYLMTKAYQNGMPGSTEMNGSGGDLNQEYTFEYDGDNVMTSYTMIIALGDGSGNTTMSGAQHTVENGRIVRWEGIGGFSGTSGDITYDDAGLVSTVDLSRQSSGSQVASTYELTYDEAGRITKKTSKSDGSESSVSYDYNDAGQLISVADQFGTSTFSYDELGRIVSAQNAYQAFDFEYNDVGQLVTKRMWWCTNGERVGDPSLVTYSYDDDGRLISGRSITEGSASNFAWTGDITYNAHGLIESVHRDIDAENRESIGNQPGVDRFEYKRVFTAKDAPDVEMPLVVGDPVAITYSHVPMQLPIVGRDVQSPAAYWTCVNVFCKTFLNY